MMGSIVIGLLKYFSSLKEVKKQLMALFVVFHDFFEEYDHKVSIWHLVLERKMKKTRWRQAQLDVMSNNFSDSWDEIEGLLFLFQYWNIQHPKTYKFNKTVSRPRPCVLHIEKSPGNGPQREIRHSYTMI